MPATAHSLPTEDRWDRAAAVSTLAECDRTAELLSWLDSAWDTARDQVQRGFEELNSAAVLAQLGDLDIERLRDVSTEQLRIGALRGAGFRTVADVARASWTDLDAVIGVGPVTVNHLRTAADQLARAVRQSIARRIEVRPEDPIATGLVAALRDVDALSQVRGRYDAQIQSLKQVYRQHRAAARPAQSRLRAVFSSSATRRAMRGAVAELDKAAGHAVLSGLPDAAAQARNLLTTPRGAAEIWADFARRAATYYAVLESVVGAGPAEVAQQVPAELLDRINTQELDESLLRVSLRGYQAFGAKYALAQKRVIIGDEMGLGKTIQAIAVIAHCAVTHSKRGFSSDSAPLPRESKQPEPFRALVICPASVLTNWAREIAAHSALTARVLHGEGAASGMEKWLTKGGVAVTTYGHLRALAAHLAGAAGVLVVDEAHYVKNPEARRSQAVAALAARAERVLLLTGTPMENRVAELRELIAVVRPDLVGTLDYSAARILVGLGVDAPLGMGAAARFRRAVAPVYLRRNRRDVLQELPELIQVDEWERLGATESARYIAAVREGRFMAMRQAAYAVEFAEDSAKMRRLVELVQEATENGHKVVVFSFFRSVVELTRCALGDLAIGELTGSVPVTGRQVIVDQFTASAEPKALVCQIDVGGVGLNLQAASVVILCEPQLKPTTEEQAIARVHRMGQVDTVQVHRLLGVDTVDERLVELLATKAKLFDAYARRSTVAEEASGAMDVSEASLARSIIAAEQTRLFTNAGVTGTRDAAVTSADVTMSTDAPTSADVVDAS